jgi:hypothetical protein
MKPKGTSDSAIAEATKHIKSVAAKCPNTVIVAGGFRYVTISYSLLQDLIVVLTVKELP